MEKEESPMNPMDRTTILDEEKLVLDAAGGDLQAFNELVLMYQDMAFHHAYSLLHDPAAAEDATQESFIKAFQAVNRFRGGSFRSWLLRIITNTAYDMLRRSAHHPVQPLFPETDDGEEMESPAWISDPAASVQGAVEQNETTRELYRKMDELPEVYRSVLTLVDVYEMDYEEAARTLKVPLGTIKSRLARARLQMQEKLSKTSRVPSCSTIACLAV
jgi:RNA polymerase sigma-70 factor (ECF subfamily)